jgi:hypothetical protein
MSSSSTLVMPYNFSLFLLLSVNGGMFASSQKGGCASILRALLPGSVFLYYIHIKAFLVSATSNLSDVNGLYLRFINDLSLRW